MSGPAPQMLALAGMGTGPNQPRPKQAFQKGATLERTFN
jgi:hypothetical protein